MPLIMRTLPAALCVLAALAPAPALAKSSPPAPAPLANARALLVSRELWGTIDVCAPTDQPDTVGIRGSMPGDGHSGDRMYMRFRLQYMNPSKHWSDVAGAISPYGPVGAGGEAREGGSSFQLVPIAGKPASKLRGVVDFQWRRGRKVLLSVSRPTGAGHKAVAGADPEGFSAATCLIG